MTLAIAPRFAPRTVPLTPVAVAVPTALCGVLVERWRRDPSVLQALRAVATPSALLLFGDADTLPWVDGVVYLGRDPDAPRLLVPTAVAPDVPMALFEKALFARHPEARPPAALLWNPPRLVDALSPAPFDLASVTSWVARGSS